MISEWQKIAGKHLADYRHAVRSVKEEQTRLAEAEQEWEDVKQAQTVIQTVAQEVQTKAHERIASIISHCLRAVFDPKWSFQLHFERRGGKTDARMTFAYDGQEVSPRGASSGGVIDVAAFALRAACLVLAQPPARRLLILDEPFKWVNGEEYQNRVAKLLETLAEEMGMQIIMATDDPWLMIGNVIPL